MYIMYGFLDFIEIGTSDFDTEVEKKDNKKGLSIEPIKNYFDKLPYKEGCIKINKAISNYDGELTLYYIPEDVINKYYLPLWMKGCGSVNKRHVNVQSMLKEHSLEISKLTSACTVPCTTLNNIIEEYAINGVYYLKIDTEGHDTVILDYFLNNITDNSCLPHKIMFESNNLTAFKDKKKILSITAQKGYDIEYSSKDTVLNLNLCKLQNKSMFSEKIQNYKINRYPKDYDSGNPPHGNTLEEAQAYCMKNNYTGVVYKDGKYEVRTGIYLIYDNTQECEVWVFL